MDEKYVVYKERGKFVIKCYQDGKFVGSTEYDLQQREIFLNDCGDFKRYVPHGRILIGYRSADGVMELSDILIKEGLILPKRLNRELAFVQPI